jgi:hypothetical protein
LQRARHGAQQRGFAQSGYTLQQDMAGGDQADDHALNHILLANYDLCNLVTDFVEFGNSQLEARVGSHDFIVVHRAKRQGF